MEYRKGDKVILRFADGTAYLGNITYVDDTCIEVYDGDENEAGGMPYMFYPNGKEYNRNDVKMEKFTDFGNRVEAIAEKIDNALIDIFAELQDEAGITSGDVGPFELMEYDEACEALAKKVCNILNGQQIYNKEF